MNKAHTRPVSEETVELADELVFRLRHEIKKRLATPSAKEIERLVADIGISYSTYMSLMNHGHAQFSVDTANRIASFCGMRLILFPKHLSNKDIYNHPDIIPPSVFQHRDKEKKKKQGV